MCTPRSQNGSAFPNVQAMSIGPTHSLDCLGQKLGLTWLSVLLGVYLSMSHISPAHSHSFFSLIQQL